MVLAPVLWHTSNSSVSAPRQSFKPRDSCPWAGKEHEMRGSGGEQPVGEGKLWFLKLREHITQASEPADSLAGLSARDYFGERLLRSEMYKIVFNQTWNFCLLFLFFFVEERPEFTELAADCFILKALDNVKMTWRLKQSSDHRRLGSKNDPSNYCKSKSSGEFNYFFWLVNQLISRWYQLESEGPLDETY